MIGLILAMKSEQEHLIARLENQKAEEISSRTFITGTIAGVDVVMVVCGVGKVNAAICAQTLILRYKPELIINCGVAGSLTDELNVGDIAIGTDVVQHDFDTSPFGDPIGFVSTVDTTYFPLDKGVSEKLFDIATGYKIARAKHARLASGDQVVATTERRNEIVRLFGGEVCDMEAGAIAHACLLNNVPCAVIRAISDSANEESPMTYAEFLPLAAKNSSEILLKYLESL